MATESFFSSASLALLASAAAGKDGKAYSIKPNDGTGDFTFSRGSNLTATRVGADGLIEKGRENLLLQSNNFSTTWATSTSASVTSSQSGYDGSSDAWLLSKTAANQYIQQQLAFGGINTFSVYIKAGTSTWVALMRGDGQKAFFDLNGSGDLGNVTSGITSKIESAGNGWFRCSFVFENSTTNYARIYPAEGNGDTSGTSGTIYIQDAQLEIGLAATDYIESGATTGKAGLLEDEPRFDYSGGATCPSLSLEPSRTNLIGYSEYLDGIAWSGEIGTSFDTNTTISPEGLENSALLKEDSSNGSHFAYRDFSLTSGSTYTISIFAKSNGTNRNLRLSTGGLGWSSIFNGIFDLTAGTATGGTIEPMGSGWYRCSVTGTTNATTSRLIIYSLLNTSTSYQGDGSSGVYLYGLQLEKGSYPTSYIPNHSGGSVTRGYDITDRGANLSYTGDYTLFMEFELTKDGVYLLGANNSTSYNIFIENNDCYFQFGRLSGDSAFVSFVDKFNWVANLGSTVKMAFYKNGTSSKMFVNGTEYTPSSNTLTTGNEFLDWRYLDYTTLANRQEQVYIKQLLEFQEALSDANCIALTTL